MRNKAGIFCIVTGVLLMLGALGLHYFNMQEDSQAQTAVRQIIPQLIEEIQENTELETDSAEEDFSQLQIPPALLTEEDKAMTEVEIDGYFYIGYVSIPTQELDLPVMSSWSYPQLSISPCRYSGSVRGDDMVVMGHNYVSHFGKLSNLQPGDVVRFTDMDGVVTEYEVVGKDLLPAAAVEEMTSGDFDLTLFTCNYSGNSRVTIYCNRTDN